MLNNEFPPLGGGTGTVNLAILEQFANEPGLAIDLITASEGNEFRQEKFSERINIFKIPVNRFNIHHASNQELIIYALRAFSHGYRLHRHKNYDLCFAWSAVPAGASALALRITTGLRYIVRVCGPDIPGFEQRYSYLYPFLKFPIRTIWRRADTVVAKCEGEAAMIRAVDRDTNITIIPNGVDTDVFQPGSTIPNGGPLKLLCVARLIKRKGQHHLIEVVKQLTDQGVDVSLDLIGTGDAKDEYKGLVNSLGVADRIKFHGYIPREQMPDIYTQAHVFVLPSYNEGMSVSTLEAMAAGLPVIVTHTPGTEELVEEGVNGFSFSWGDKAKLLQCIIKLDTDRALARQMGIASRNMARKYSWSSSSDKYLQSIFSRYIPTLQSASID